MPQLITATYLVRRGGVQPPDANAVAQAFFAARDEVGAGAFPYDAADDPAFYSAKHFGGKVTWGVCRTDARNLIEPGDWVAFFASEKQADKQGHDYRLTAILQVAKKVSGWAPPVEYDGYLNRMVYSEGGQWVHRESALERNEWHADWLWRLSQRRRAYADVKEAATLGRKDVVSDSHRVRAGADAVNYVVFDQAAGFNLSSPRLVARRAGTELQEEWLPAAEPLRDLLFAADAKFFLRTKNKQQPHRHTRRHVPNADAVVARAQVLARQLPV